MSLRASVLETSRKLAARRFDSKTNERPVREEDNQETEVFFPAGLWVLEELGNHSCQKRVMAILKLKEIIASITSYNGYAEDCKWTSIQEKNIWTLRNPTRICLCVHLSFQSTKLLLRSSKFSVCWSAKYTKQPYKWRVTSYPSTESTSSSSQWMGTNSVVLHSWHLTKIKKISTDLFALSLVQEISMISQGFSEKQHSKLDSKEIEAQRTSFLFWTNV